MDITCRYATGCYFAVVQYDVTIKQYDEIAVWLNERLAEPVSFDVALTDSAPWRWAARFTTYVFKNEQDRTMFILRWM